MFVRDRMTRNPVVVRPQRDPVAALRVTGGRRQKVPDTITYLPELQLVNAAKGAG